MPKLLKYAFWALCAWCIVQGATFAVAAYHAFRAAGYGA